MEGVLRLSELIASERSSAAPPDLDIRGLAWDSRDVQPGYLFAALDGTQARGVDFIPDAMAHGAVAILAPEGTDPLITGSRAPVLTDPNPRRQLALMAARFYGRQPAVVAAVTGTNGKTSVAEFTRQIWACDSRKAGSLGSLGACADGISRSLRHTTPDPITLHAVIAELAAEGVSHLVLEASSHGLEQHRIDGLEIKAAAFTNLTRDHMDYHADAAAYLAAKRRLFTEVLVVGGTAVLNGDAPEFADLARASRQGGRQVLSYGGRRDADLRLLERSDTADGQVLELDAMGRRCSVMLPLPGPFQVSNALAAVGLAVSTGVERDTAIAALGDLSGVRGRLEEVARHPAGAPVYVDYAHTPDALGTVLEAVRPRATGRVVVVFGCGGERDIGKRAEMGALAARLADHVIVTDDNPRGEAPEKIRADILAACPGAQEIGDRGEAIAAAVSTLTAGDVLVVAGKGHEQGQTVGDDVIPFDDATVARRAVAAVRKGAAP